MSAAPGANTIRGLTTDLLAGIDAVDHRHRRNIRPLRRRTTTGGGPKLFV